MPDIIRLTDSSSKAEPFHLAKVIVVDDVKNLDETALSSIENACRQELPPLVIIYASYKAVQSIKDIINRIPVFKLISTDEKTDLQTHITAALEEYHQAQVNQQLNQMSKELLRELKVTQEQLHLRVHSHRGQIQDTKKKLSDKTEDLQILLEALVALQSSKSVAEIEISLLAVLKKKLPINKLRISFRTDGVDTGNINMWPIESSGAIVGLLLTELTGKLSRAEKELISQITKGVGLGLTRLAHYEQLEQVKQQWQATFNAVRIPFAIVNESNSVIQSNIAYQNMQKQTLTDRIYATHSVDLQDEPKLTAIYYRDTTDRQRFEHQLSESAKLAELGNISGSLAHELNNPIAGMLTFAQLIRSDLNGTEHYHDDIHAIEKDVQQCREIVQNLLVFARTNPDPHKASDLLKIINRAKNLVELGSLTSGVSVKIIAPEENFSVNAIANTLTQSFVNILQSVAEQLRNRGLKPEIKVELYEADLGPEVTITPLNPNTEAPQIFLQNQGQSALIAIDVARRLIEQSGGAMSLETTPPTWIKISFSRPDF